MSIEVKVPQLPESVTDATLVAWHKSPGESVKRDENLVDLETDKVVLEVPAPASGVISAIQIENGATVTSGQLLATLEPGETSDATPPPLAVPGPQIEPSAAPEATSDVHAGKLGPAVRRMLEEHDIDPVQVHGSGKGGRILKSDVQTHVDGGADAVSPIEDMPGALPMLAPATQRAEHRVPMSRLRARIAERMVEAQQSAAMLTTFNEIDLSAVIGLRQKYKEAFEKQNGVRLGFMSFFINASIEALKRFPVVNASIEANDIVYHEYFYLGLDKVDPHAIPPSLTFKIRYG
jgi:2-oxoglutarate dehydrogenase E2 component (dihydrolipoamide succinyltransferase)